MARSTFLGTTDFALFEKSAAGYWKDADQEKTLTFSDVDGNPVNVVVDGVEVPSVVVPPGELPPFVQGPDGMDILYVDAGGGRVPVGPSRGSAAPTWAALPDKPTIPSTPEEVGALPADTPIPSTPADIGAEVAGAAAAVDASLAPVAKSGNYTDLAGKPAIPDNTTVAGYVTNAGATKDALSATYVSEDSRLQINPAATAKRGRMPSVMSLIAGHDDETYILSNCTASADTVNYKVGDRGVKVSIASATTASIAVDPIPGALTDPATVPPFQAVCLWVYVPDVTKITGMGIYLYTDSGLTDGKRWTRHNSTAPSFGLVNGWNLVRIPTDFDTQTLGGWTSSLYRATVYVGTNAATEVTIGHLYLETPPKARLLFVADRGYKTFHTSGYPALKALGVPVTWAIDVTLQGTGTGNALALTEAEVAQVATENGNSISFHGWDGAVTSSMTAAQYRADTIKALKYLSSKGYAGRMWRAAVVQNAATNYAAAAPLLLGSGHAVGTARPTPWPPRDMQVIPRNALDNNSTTADIDARFAYLKRTHMMECVYIHAIGPEINNCTQALFDYYVSKVQAAIDEGWLEPVTFEQLFYEMGGQFTNVGGAHLAQYVDPTGATVTKRII